MRFLNSLRDIKLVENISYLLIKYQDSEFTKKYLTKTNFFPQEKIFLNQVNNFYLKNFPQFSQLLLILNIYL